MSRLTLLALSAALLVPAAHADQLQEVLQRKELRCGTLADIPPFATPDPKTRELSGFDVDMCRAVAKRLGVPVTLVPMSIEARIPEVKMGRVDIAIANLFYTLGRAEQIQFSNAYYLAKEVIMTRASETGGRDAFKGKRLTASKGSTSEIGIKLNGSEPLTFQDTGSAYMALLQNKAAGMVGNPLTLTKFIAQAKASGVELKMLEDEPLVVAPVAVGMKKGEPTLLAAVNKTLSDMESAGEIDAIWDKWLGPKSEYKITRKEKVTPISELNFNPAP